MGFDGFREPILDARCWIFDSAVCSIYCPQIHTDMHRFTQRNHLCDLWVLLVGWVDRESSIEPTSLQAEQLR